MKNAEQVLYPNCLCDHWDMNHSERMALVALLVRHQPQCCIEIGTYKGGSLSLLVQYAPRVYSIDINPEIPRNLGYLKNVHFLTGPSQKLLPHLFKELNEQNIAVDLILVDGDHSTEAVKQDINNILDYVPKKPLFLIMHDTFDPKCRRGILDAKWHHSLYADMVDIDFIPGRVVEHGGHGDGELWDGFGLAYFLPTKRKGKLAIMQSAQKMFEMNKALVAKNSLFYE